MSDWTPTDVRFPPEGVVVNALDSGGHVHQLLFERGLWFLPDRSMYVYFVPRFWQEVAA